MTPPTPSSPITFVAAMRHFFGNRPGTGLKEFNDELKAIMPQRAEWVAMLRSAGYNITNQ